jgi:hypothetical protein
MMWGRVSKLRARELEPVLAGVELVWLLGAGEGQRVCEVTVGPTAVSVTVTVTSKKV